MSLKNTTKKMKKDKLRAKARLYTIKHLNKQPVIKNISIEEIKKGFAATTESS